MIANKRIIGKIADNIQPGECVAVNWEGNKQYMARVIAIKGDGVLVKYGDRDGFSSEKLSYLRRFGGRRLSKQTWKVMLQELKPAIPVKFAKKYGLVANTITKKDIVSHQKVRKQIEITPPVSAGGKLHETVALPKLDEIAQNHLRDGKDVTYHRSGDITLHGTPPTLTNASDAAAAEALVSFH